MTWGEAFTISYNILGFRGLCWHSRFYHSPFPSKCAHKNSKQLGLFRLVGHTSQYLQSLRTGFFSLGTS